jgi:multiple sugar transport system substrate-binding protein
VTRRLTRMVFLSLLLVSLVSMPLFAAPTTIVVMTRVGPEGDAIKAVVPEYERITGNKVVIDEAGRDGYFERQAISLMAGTDVDVILYMSDYAAAWASAGLLAPMSDYLHSDESMDLDDFYPAMIDAFSYKGEIYGLPTDVSTWLFHYNTKFLDETQVPETYDEYLELAKQFTKKYNPDSPTEYGTNVRGMRGSESPIAEWFQILWAMGGELFDENWRPRFNDEIGVAALEFHSGLFLEWGVVPPDVASLDAAGVIESFRQEKSAFLQHWNSDTVIFMDPERSPRVANNLGVTLIPGVRQPDGTIRRTPLTHGWGLGIPASSRNKEAAADFIKWVTGTEAARIYLLAGGTPARQSVLSNPEFVSVRPELPILAETLKYAKAKPSIPEWAQISDILQVAHSRVFVGELTPKEALDDAAQQVTELLKAAGYYN